MTLALSCILLCLSLDVRSILSLYTLDVNQNSESELLKTHISRKERSLVEEILEDPITTTLLVR